MHTQWREAAAIAAARRCTLQFPLIGLLSRPRPWTWKLGLSRPSLPGGGGAHLSWHSFAQGAHSKCLCCQGAKSRRRSYTQWQHHHKNLFIKNGIPLKWKLSLGYIWVPWGSLVNMWGDVLEMYRGVIWGTKGDISGTKGKYRGT